jgi:hypothetical protein
MLREARRLRLPRTFRTGALLAGVPLALVSTLLALQGTASPAAVLVVVPAGAKLAVVEKARSALRGPRRALLVAEYDRVVLEGGFEMLVDRPFARAPEAEVLVLLEGEPGRAGESFLLERRKTAKAILLPRGSPLAEKLREAGSGGALILLGGSESIGPLLDALGGATPSGSVTPVAAEGEAPRATPTARASSLPVPVATESAPAKTATPVAGRVFDRYFSSRPTPSPTPR